jgi:hypothetical protein
MNRQDLSKCIAGSNLHAGRLVSVVEVLRPLADDCVAVDLIVLADRKGADQASSGADHVPCPELDLAFNDGKSPHGNIGNHFHLSRH